MNFYNLGYNLNVLDRGIYRWWQWSRVRAKTVSRRCDNASVRLPLLRQRFHEDIGGYNICHAMCQVFKLSRELRDVINIGSDTTITRLRTSIAHSSLNSILNTSCCWYVRRWCWYVDDQRHSFLVTVVAEF